MSRVELHHGAATDVGLVRSANEDSYLAAPPVFVVADGMGGHDHGDVASRFVVEEFARLAEDGIDGLDDEACVTAVAATFRRVQARIASYDAQERAAGNASSAAGTTAVVAMMLEHAPVARWLLANVGDSRIYKFNEGRLEQVSVDHSVVQELIDSGRITRQQADGHPSRNVITRALGVTTNGEADYFSIPLSSAERVLLCSDGVSGMVDDALIEQILGRTGDPRDAAEQLVAAAVTAGGRDNATAVVVDVVGLAHETTYDSDAQRLSLEEKLGALP
ncbi:MAG: protein phosphatase 2C domain-containing protein [Nocardioidaceae bacterium]|nr:protein phosphatase 2C domain-containing protein [Nocardioidaceae bacterium]MCL2612065.1 protein phosphatase 2C domain-containing protein [Nocardioidaceae bacterium]